MKLTTLALSSAIIIATATAGFASCRNHQAMSCAEGTIYDVNTRSCVPVEVSS